MHHFEETIARLAAAEYCEFQPVSGPNMFSEILCVLCSSIYLHVFHVSVHSAKQVWRGRISPTCVSSAPYAQLIRRRPTSSAGSVRRNGKVKALDLTAATMTAAATGTCKFCTHVRPSVCPRWRGSPTAPLSEPVLHAAWRWSIVNNTAKISTALAATWSFVLSAWKQSVNVPRPVHHMKSVLVVWLLDRPLYLCGRENEKIRLLLLKTKGIRIIVPCKLLAIVDVWQTHML